MEIIAASGGKYRDFHRVVTDILKRINALGFRAYNNPVILYSAANYCKIVHNNNYIYGIMQIFGLKLSKSIESGLAFALAKLKLEFAIAMKL